MEEQGRMPPGQTNPPNREIVEIPCEDYDSIPINTLDFGFCHTLWFEMQEMCFKFSFVLIPRDDRGSARLRNWDLWGPFLMCLFFGFFIDSTEQFLLLFGSVFGGALVVTFNTRILGGNITYFQSVAILGYCIFPLFIMLCLLKLLQMMGMHNILVKLVGILLGSLWGTYSAQKFIATNIPQDKHFVSLYPICLFYLFIGFLVLYM